MRFRTRRITAEHAEMEKRQTYAWVLILLLVLAVGGWMLGRTEPDAGARVVESMPTGPAADSTPEPRASAPVQPASPEPHSAPRVGASAVTPAMNPLEVLVRDGRGAPVPGATLSVIPSGADRPAVLVDGEGKAVLRSRPVEPETLLVTAVGYDVKHVDAPPIEQESLTVVLSATCALSGVVVLKGSGRPAPGVVVAADEHGRRIKGSERWRQYVAGDSSVRAATTDSEGRFTILGLEVGKRYGLRSGGRGLLDDSANITAHVAPEEGIVLEVEQAFVLSMVFQDAKSGELLPIQGQPLGSLVVTARATDRAVRQLDTTGSFQSFLAGLNPDTYSDPNCMTLMFKYPEKRSEVGPIVVDVQIQGFERATVQLFAQGVTEANGGQIVQVVRTAEGFGDIGLSWNTGRPPREVGAQPVPMGELHLIREGSPELRLAVPLREDSEILLTRVPTGRYEWFVTANYGAFRFPRDGRASDAIEVRAGEKSDVVVPCDDGGAIDLKISRHDGGAYDSTVQLRLQRTQPPSSGGLVTFSGPPYRLIGLQSGTYSLEVYAPIEIYRDPNLQPPTIEVRPGEEQIVTLTLPRRP